MGLSNVEAETSYCLQGESWKRRGSKEELKILPRTKKGCFRVRRIETSKGWTEEVFKVTSERESPDLRTTSINFW